MSDSNRDLKEDQCDGRDKSKGTPHRQRREGYKNNLTANPTREAGRRSFSRAGLPLIGSSGTRDAGRSALSTTQRTPQTGRRKRAHAPVSVLTDAMTPWEGSSHSESSFTSIPPPPPPPPPSTAKDAPPPPPQTVKSVQPESGQNVRVKRRPLSPRRSSRPTRFPPVRQVTNLSFSRSFTFSFFELPLHQSSQSRAERLRYVAVLLKQMQY